MSNPSITLPPNLLKNLPLEQLRTISDNESSFYEYFSTLELEEVSSVPVGKMFCLKFFYVDCCLNFMMTFPFRLPRSIIKGNN